jgi:hypothetical protein
MPPHARRHRARAARKRPRGAHRRGDQQWNDRCDIVEAHMANGANGASDIDARFAAALQKAANMLKEKHIAKIEKMAAEPDDKEPNNNLEPAAGNRELPENDDRYKFGRLDPSTGAQSQKTPRHPMGDTMMRSYEKAKHFDRELVLKRDMIAKIAEGNKQRWG